MNSREKIGCGDKMCQKGQLKRFFWRIIMTLIMISMKYRNVPKGVKMFQKGQSQLRLEGGGKGQEITGKQ